MVKNCKDCVYFGDYKDDTPNSKFKWTHCNGQVYNLSDSTATQCPKYAFSITDALIYICKQHTERMNWAFPIDFKLPVSDDCYYLTNISKTMVCNASLSQLKEMALEIYTLSRLWRDQKLDGKAVAYEDLFYKIGGLIHEKEVGNNGKNWQ